ncbi:MAG: efflux RND transporter periplasmic adaptor subunit [Verrucomicrobia bacterium]|nr:efflux RND transporter periplasmic adaptor subunit [Verrucomicrobiota bacterium]NDE98360.1 efflux RND transporter periplasmic adaptor subunit [Verrucomicrobiota bacterium]
MNAPMKAQPVLLHPHPLSLGEGTAPRTLDFSPRTVPLYRWLRFTLSQRERVGVREKVLLGLSIAVALLSTASCLAQTTYSGAGASGGSSAPTVRVATPTRGDVHRFVAQPGTIRPLQQATLYARLPGYVKRIAVDKGDAVKAGALLAELDAPELALDLARARGEFAKARADVARASAELAKSQADIARTHAEVALAKAGAHKAEAELHAAIAVAARAQAELPKAQAEVNVARLDYDRLTEGRRKAPDLVVPAQVDAAKARLDTATAQVGVLRAAAEAAAAEAEAAKARRAGSEASIQAASAQAEAAKASHEAARAVVGAFEAAVEVAQSAMQRTSTLADFTRLTAPFSGVVTARFVDLGAFVPAATAGNAAQNAAVVTLMDFDTVRVQVPMTELEAGFVAKGQPVKVALDGLPGKIFEGTVTRFAGALDEATRTMLVEAELPNPGHALRPGMYATVRVGVEKHTNVLLVPSEALVMEKANAFVFLADGSKAKKTPVKIGFNDGAKVEIVSGLAESAKVILIGKLALTDGQAINVQEGK